MSVRGEKGQTLVEFALVLPVVVLLVVGMLQFGRLLNIWLIVSNGAREGARHAAVGLTEAEVTQNVRDACPTLDLDSLAITVIGAEGPKGVPVTVAVEYPVDITPLFEPLFPQDPYPVSADVTMRME